MGIILAEFFLCAAVIVVSGTFLSRYGDVLSEKVGLGRAWIGLILMASVTSLPELINGISSVTIADVPDIAIGDLMGSCVFNLSLIALMDALYRPGPIFMIAEHGHILSAGFGMILIGIAAVSIFMGPDLPALGHIGLYTPLIIFIYFVGIRSVYLFEKRKIAEFAEGLSKVDVYAHVSLKEAVVKYVLNAAVIIVAATILPFLGDRLAAASGLGRSFVGTFFIGITTSMPELVVSVASLRIGAADMAIANLFGSNMFNMFILAIDDLFYGKGPLLSYVSGSHSVTAIMALIMTGIAIVALTYRLKKKTVLRIGWDAVALLLAFIINVLLLYKIMVE